MFNPLTLDLFYPIKMNVKVNYKLLCFTVLILYVKHFAPYFCMNGAEQIRVIIHM